MSTPHEIMTMALHVAADILPTHQVDGIEVALHEAALIQDTRKMYLHVTMRVGEGLAERWNERFYSLRNWSSVRFPIIEAIEIDFKLQASNLVTPKVEQ